MLLYADHFGDFWTTPPGTFTSTTAASITGGRLRVNFNGGGCLVANQITSQATFIINMRLNIQALPGGVVPFAAAFFTLHDTPFNVDQTSLMVYSTGKIGFAQGGTFFSTPIGSISNIALLADAGVTYYDVEAKVMIADSGNIEARVNGGVAVPSTVADTRNSTSTSVADAVNCFGGTSGLGGGPWLVEHLLVMDTQNSPAGTAMKDFIGPVDVTFLPPTGDGFYTAWNVTNPPNVRWQAVDDSDPDEDTSYVFSNTVGDKNTFTHSALPISSTTVKAVALWGRARRDDGLTRAFKFLLRNTTPTDNLSPNEFFLGDDYLYFFQEYGLSPFTSIAWTVSEVNNVEYGLQLTT